MRVDKRQILRNVGSSWFALGMNVVTGIFLSPYILHRLGDNAFGLWILILSVTGYYGLFDLGIRSSIVRYIAKYSATDELDELNRLVNTAMFSYTGIGVVTMTITLIAAYFVNRIFHIPPEFVSTARWLLLMAGTSVSVGFPLGVFSGILEGLQRFYLLNFTSISSTLVRTLLIVIALRHGYGLLTVALITVSLPLLGSLINAAAVFRHLRLRFGPQYVKRSSLRRIASYSGTTFLIIVAGRLRFKTDALVIGTFVSAAAVTYFTIGSRLVDYASEVVGSLAQIFVPMSSQSQAKGDLDALRKIFVAGNRACAFIVFPITVILTILGKSVIESWVGPKYIATSYPVLLILLYPSTLMLAQSASGRTLWGMAKHRTWAWVVLAEGISNLILSMILVRPYGIIGDAIGTAIPLTCSMIFFLPRHLCRLLGIKLTTYLYRAFVLPLALCTPMVAVLLLMQRWYIPHRLGPLLIQLVIASLVYGAGLAWAFWTHRAWDVGQLGGNREDEISLALVETYQEEA
ncbi:MAG TPA: oligosaccharide flippase family protein [Candidatus Acidoferrum sp.]|jgi:O-antigen/teichoic acid export membrane protein|nr:oligosaccharide flippase family protein [Candidatus Acidoferrum sp.]